MKMKQQMMNKLGLLVGAVAVAMAPAGSFASSSGRGAPMVPAVIVFGDSIVDPGNNNNLKTQIKANHAPYGMDFANSEPTGRYSNGLIPTDFIGTVSYSLFFFSLQQCNTSLRACMQQQQQSW